MSKSLDPTAYPWERSVLTVSHFLPYIECSSRVSQCWGTGHAVLLLCIAEFWWCWHLWDWIWWLLSWWKWWRFIWEKGCMVAWEQCCGSGSTGSTCFWASRIRIRIQQSKVWIRIRILLSSCKNSNKNRDSSCFVTLFEFLSLKNDVNVASKSHKKKKLC